MLNGTDAAEIINPLVGGDAYDCISGINDCYQLSFMPIKSKSVATNNRNCFRFRGYEDPSNKLNDSRTLCNNTIAMPFVAERYGVIMTSIKMRNNPLFMRNTFTPVGKWGIPLVRNQQIQTSDIRLVSCSDTRANDSEENRKAGVHFFVDDYRFTGIYDHPDKSIEKYAQYAFLLTPDFSLYADMQPWKQLENVAKNRWVGAYWQRPDCHSDYFVEYAQKLRVLL